MNTWRGRPVVAGVAGVVAVLAVVASVAGVWARAVLFDSDKVAAVVANTLAEPDVTAGLSVRIADAVIEAADVDGYVEQVLPDSLQGLRPAVVGGLEAVVQRQAQRLLEREETRVLLTEAVRQAHRALMRVLEGEGLVDGIRVRDGEVSINLLPVIGRVMAAVQSTGLLSDLVVPELTRDGDPDEQIAALEQAFGRELRPDFGQFVVYRSDTVAEAQATVATAQRGMVLVKRAVWVILALTVALIAATILLARQRLRAVLILALGVSAALIVTRRVVQQVAAESPNLVLDPAGRSAVASIVNGLVSGLLAAVAVLTLLALVTAAASYLAGPSERATRWRQALQERSGSFDAVLDEQRNPLALVGFALAVVILGTAGVSGWSLLVAGAVATAAAWILWHPDRTDPTPTDPTDKATT